LRCKHVPGAPRRDKDPTCVAGEQRHREGPHQHGERWSGGPELFPEKERQQWFGGESFGWADLSVIPYINGSSGQGIGPEPSSKLGQWQARANARPSVQKTSAAAADSIKGMAQVSELVKQRLFKREYRDHRLEWMIRSGGLEVVLEGIKSDTIRFSHEFK